MSKLTRLQARLTTIQARISNIETIYPTLVKVKSYEHGIAGMKTTYQEFGDVGQEYRLLLEQEERLEDAIDVLQGNSNGNTSVPYFR